MNTQEELRVAFEEYEKGTFIKRRWPAYQRGGRRNRGTGKGL